MTSLGRLHLMIIAIMLGLVVAPVYAGFTSIPIRQDPRFISNYNSNSTSTYWDRLIVETISDSETWVAWVNDNPADNQRCEIRSTERVHRIKQGKSKCGGGSGE